MKCKNCGAKVSDTERFCPTCGEELRPLETESHMSLDVAEAEEKLDSSPEPAPDPTGGDDVFAPAPAKRKSKAPVIIVAVLLLAALAIGLVAGGVIPTGGGGEPSADTVMAWMGKHQLTNQQMAYYYWEEVYSLSSYGLVSLDTPLSEQEYPYEDYATWHEALVDQAVDVWASHMKVYEVAVAEGHQIDTAYAEYLNSMGGYIAEDAAAQGLESADLLLTQDYGEFATVETFQEYMTVYLTVNSFINTHYNELVEPHLAGLEMVDSVNIRHILFKTGTEDDEAVRTQADAVYDTFLADATEERFSMLAMEHSEDGNALQGGIYEGVYPGQMVSEFNDWCFDPARQVGDSGIVQTTYGYHLMYYSGTGDPVPADSAASDAAYEEADLEYEAWINELLGEPDYSIYADKVYKW